MVDELETLAPGDVTARAAAQLVGSWSPGPSEGDALAAAAEAVGAAARTDDPVSMSTALDVLTFRQVMAGRLGDGEALAQQRLGLLTDLPKGPTVALELKDALHMAIQLDCGTANLARAVDESRRHRSLLFLREQRDLAVEPVLLPLALAGHHDELFEAAEEFADDWAASGRPVAPARALGPYAVACAHAMCGHDAASRRWFALVAAMQGRPTSRAGRGTGYAVVLDALLLLHRDRPERALEALSSTTEPGSEWYARLFAWWAPALRAEAAVLSDSPDSGPLLEEAQRLCASSETLSLVVRRARALAEGEAAVLATVAEHFEDLEVPYQARRTRRLAGR